MPLNAVDLALVRLWTDEAHRHHLRYEVDDDWQAITIWCELHPTQEENRP